jgi:serine/threonine-protein kinase
MLDASASLWEDVMSRLRQATTGEFQILDELGRGGMAAVYLAHDLALNRRVAIKVMAPGLLLGPGMVERFRQEAITVANLNHPHIVTIHAVRQAAGLHYFVMKLIPGASVERIIREVRPLSIPVVQALVHQIAGALQYAHRRGVIHRDVKPSNILLDDDGNAVVTDFGIAKVVESPSHTQTGATIGTPAYMSPEQCWSREVTAASDQYSLGIVVYEMLTGKPPFSGPTLAILRAHTEEPPPPILDARPECPPHIAQAVHRMLDKEASARWPTVLRAAEAMGCRQPNDDDSVRDDLLRLSQLGPDHPLQTIYTPHSPIPVRSRPDPPVSPAPAKVPEESIEVRIRPSPASPAPVAGPQESPVPQPQSVVGDRWRFSKLWWLVPAAAMIALGLWWTNQGDTEPSVVAHDPVVDTVRPPEPPEPPSVQVASVEVAGVPQRVVSGDRFFLAATARGAQGEALAGREVSWASDRPGIAEVSETGEVTARAPGRAAITATVGRETASVSVVVLSQRVVAAKVTPASLRLEVGDTAVVRASLVDDRGQAVPSVVIWEASDSRIAMVTQDGKVIARGPGTTRIVATGDGVQGVSTVTVRDGGGPPQPPPPTARRTAILRMLVAPWADVTIDGQARGRRTRGEDTLVAGVPHRVQFAREGYVPVDTLVTLRPAERRLIRILLTRRVP